MLDQDQLNAPYDISQLDGPGPKKPPVVATKPAAQEPFDIKDLDKAPKSNLDIGGARPTDVEEYGKILDQGVFSDQDIDQQRAEHQSILAKTGHMLGNLPGNIVGSFLEGIGDIGLLAGQWGDDRTYHNALIDIGEKLHNATGDIYMKHHDTIGQTLSDPGWWIDQAGTLTEFTVSYAALGAGVANTIGKTAEAAVGLIRGGELASRVGVAASQLGTAGFMAYTMGANSAGQVFKDTYETQFKKHLDAGDDPDTAKEKATHIAAQSAATTAQLTTAIGTGLALTGMAPYFSKAENTALNILRKEVPQQAGEDAATWAARVKSIDPQAYATILNPSLGLTHKIVEAGKMGIEMQQIQFGQRTGEQLGKDGKVKGFVDQFGELENYLDRTMDKDGAIAFAIGAISGIGIDKLRNDVIKSKWADQVDPSTGAPIMRKDANGEEVSAGKALYTPKKYSDLHTQYKFNQMRDAIASDISGFDKMQQAFLAATKAGDPVAQDQAARDMFNVNNVNAITSGMKDVWKQTYDQIANMTPEEAQQKGFSTNATDDLIYKDRAEKASAALDRHQKIYDDLQSKYGTLYDVNAGYKPVVDGLFSRKVHLDGWDEILKEHEEKLKKLTKDADAILPIANPELFDQNTAEYARTWESTKDSITKLTADHKRLTELADQYNSTVSTSKGRDVVAKEMAALATQYQALDPEANNSVDSINKSLKGTRDKIQETIDKHKEKLQQAEDNMLNSSTYQQWLEKHPNGSFKDYYAKVQDNIGNKEYASQIDLSRERYNIAKSNTAEIEKSKNLSRFANKYARYMQEESKKSKDLEDQYNKEIANRAKDKTTLSVAQRAQLDKMANRYKDIRDKHIKELTENKERLEEVKKEIERSQDKDWLYKRGLKGQQRDLEKKIAKDTEKAKLYHSLYEENHVDTSTDTNPISVDDVTTTPPTEQPIPELPPSIGQIDEIALANPVFADTNPTTFEDHQKLVDEQADRIEKEIDQRQQKVLTAESTFSDHIENFLSKVGKGKTTNYDGLTRLNNIQSDYKSNGAFSYDSLNLEVSKGWITQNEATNLLQSMKEYVDAENEAQIDQDIADFMVGQEAIIDDYEENEPVIVSIDADPPSDTPLTNNFDGPPSEVFKTPSDNGNGGVTFGGAKTVFANTIANSTLGYWEFAPDHNKEINLISQKDKVNEKTSMKVLSGKYLTPGTRLRYEVDTEYDGPKHLTGEFKQDEYGEVPQGRETYQDYVDEKGKIAADKMGNVPIKIVDAKSGEKVGYIRKHDWITERYDLKEHGKTGLRNIAEIYDDDGNEINEARQTKLILDIRKEIVDRFNQSGESTHGEIDSKGVGHPILNRVTALDSERSKITPGFAYNNKDGGLLPDPSLEIVIAENGSFKSGKGFTTTKDVAGDAKDLANGSVHILVPGANGQHLAVPLQGKNLMERGQRSSINTISRVLELYLQYTGEEGHPITEEINKLHTNTGFDVSKEVDVRNFINQYFTYTQRFNDTATLPSSPSRGFLFNVWDKIEGKEGKAWIKAAMGGSGEPPVYASIDPNTGKLNQKFMDILEKGLVTRSKAVVYTRDNIRGINEKRNNNNPFVDANYNSKGVWNHNKYKDYNEYVKSFSKTTAYGKNKRGNDYIYTANPSIKYHLDSHAPGADKPNITIKNSTIDKVHLPEVTKVEPVYDKGLLNELDDISFGAMQKEPVKEIGTRDEDKSQPLTIENLEKLRNLLPEEQRNGRAPGDVLRELIERGHSGLSDGYNPFSLCL